MRRSLAEFRVLMNDPAIGPWQFSRIGEETIIPNEEPSLDEVRNL